MAAGDRWLRGRAVTLAIVAETVAMALLVSWHLGTKSLHLDEGFTVALTRTGSSQFWHIITTREANQSLFYVMARPWIHLGSSEVWLRALPAAFAVATVPVLVSLGRRLFDDRTGLLAGLVFCLNGFVLFHAQFGRAYTLAVLLATSSTLLFVRAVDHPTSGRWIAWAVVGALACYSHFFAALVLIAQLVSVWWLPAQTGRRRLMGQAVALLVLLAAPLAIFLATTPGDQVDFIEPPTAHLLAHVLTSIAGHGGPALTVLAGTLGVVALWVLADHWAEGKAARWPFLLVLSWLAVPIVLAFAVSIGKPIVQDSYLLVCAPALALLSAVGLDRLLSRGPRVVGALALVATVLLGGRSVVHTYSRVNEENWRDAAELVIRDGTTADGLLFYSSAEGLPFEYHLDRLGGRSTAPRSLYPDGAYGHLEETTAEIPTYDEASLRRLLAGHQRIWVLQRGEQGGPRPRWEMSVDGYELVENHSFGNVDVSLYVGDASTSP